MSAVADVWGLLRLGSRAVKCELQPWVLAEPARLCSECEMLPKPQCSPEKRDPAEEFWQWMPFPAGDRLWINRKAQLGFLMMKSDPISRPLPTLPLLSSSSSGTANSQ